MTSALQLQLKQSLFVTTSKTILHFTPNGNKTLFECDTTDGIANARASRDNSSLFAVANSHVVMLCNAARGSRNCKLRKGNGEPRLLLFSPDSRTLYFTTTLSPSVQAYSISTAEMLPSQQPHPSPPNVIALSSDGNVLLSASSTPPTIYLQDRRMGGSAPVNFQPTDADTPVTCAAFQTRTDTAHLSCTRFVLGFQDGKMVMYRIYVPGQSQTRRRSELDRIRSFQLQPVRIGAMKKLHKAYMGGLVAAEFIPGYKSRVVSIGHEGRCRLVDFEGGVIANSAMSSGRVDNTVLFGGDAAAEDEGSFFKGSQTFIAIGTQSGKIFIFNVLGLLVHNIELNFPILAVEWVGDMSAPSVLPNRVSSMSPESQPALTTQLVDIDEFSNEELGTVKRTSLAPQRKPKVQSNIPIGVDLFSDIHMSSPKGRASEISTGSPIRLRRTRTQRPRKSMTRPRIATETFQSPILSSKHPPESALASLSSPSNPAIQHPRKRTQVYLPKVSLSPPRIRRCSPSPSSSSSSSEISEPHKTNTQFFTPPSTRRDKGKEPLRSSQPRISSPSPTSSPALVTSQSANTSVPWQRPLTSLILTPNPRRQVAPEASSPPRLNTPSSIYSQPSASKDARSGTSTPVWLKSPSSPRTYRAANAGAVGVRSNEGVDVDVDGGRDEKDVTGVDDGEMGKWWDEIDSLRREINGLKKKVEGLRARIDQGRERERL